MFKVCDGSTFRSDEEADNPELQARRHKTQQTRPRMGDKARQSAFRMAQGLVGVMNPSSVSSFAQRIIFPLQYDR
jgi:hypothetical protein